MSCMTAADLVVIANSFLLSFVSFGSGFSVGIWTSTFLSVFSSTSASAAGIGASLNTTLYAFSFVSSLFVKRLGCPRVVAFGAAVILLGRSMSYFARGPFFLQVTFGITGVGLGCGTVTAYELTAKHFEGAASLPLGIMSTGIGTGMFLLPIIDEFLISSFGWQKAVLFNGVFTSGIMVLSSIISRRIGRLTDEERASPPPPPERETVDRRQMSCVTFSSLSFLSQCVVVQVLFYIGNASFLVHLAKYVTLDTGVGASKTEAAWIVASIGVSNIAGRIFLGWICHREKVESELVMILCNIGLAASILPLPFVKSLQGAFAACSVHGFMTATIGPVHANIVENITGRRDFAVGFGISLLFDALGSMLGPPSTGFLIDHFKSYDLALYACSVSFVLAAAFGIGPLVKHVPSKRNQTYLAAKTDFETPELV